MVLVECTTYLATQSIGTVGTNLFYGILPDTPDACVTLFEYGGMPNEPNMGTGTTRLVFPRIQAVARGIKDDYDGPRVKIQDVVTAFTLIANQNLSGIKYLAILALSDPFFLRRDDNFRVEFVCNFQVTKAYSAT